MMLPFEERIAAEMKEAMKARDQVRLDTLRAMKSALKYKSVEKNQTEVTEEEAFQIFQSMIKQRKEAVEQYEKFNRKEQADQELREIDVISAFLPKPLSVDELKALIQESIQSSQAQSLKDLGKVMKDLKPKITGRADMKAVTDLVKESLPA